MLGRNPEGHNVGGVSFILVARSYGVLHIKMGHRLEIFLHFFCCNLVAAVIVDEERSELCLRYGQINDEIALAIDDNHL